RLRVAGQMLPNRQLIRSMLGSLSTIRTSDPMRLQLATSIYVWGCKSGTSGFIKTKEMFNLNIRLEECWCLLDIRLHLLRCLEWMHREVAKNQINGDIKIFLPLVVTVLNNNPSGNATVKLKGHVLATCIKNEMKSWFGNRLEARVEADERDREKFYLVVAKEQILDWMKWNFGPDFEKDTIFNALPEIRDKNFEGGTLIFSKEQRNQADDSRKQDYRRSNDQMQRSVNPQDHYSRNNDRDRRDDRRDDARDYRDNRRDDATTSNSRNYNSSSSLSVSGGSSNSRFGGNKHFPRDDNNTGRQQRRDDFISGGSKPLRDEDVGSSSGRVYDDPSEFRSVGGRVVEDSMSVGDYSYSGNQFADEKEDRSSQNGGRYWKSRD
ncbi:hypothetical protein BC830DRAFT_1087362, partial [Chytriomyces sp. MP71]